MKVGNFLIICLTKLCFAAPRCFCSDLQVVSHKGSRPFVNFPRVVPRGGTQEVDDSSSYEPSQDDEPSPAAESFSGDTSEDDDVYDYDSTDYDSTSPIQRNPLYNSTVAPHRFLRRGLYALPAKYVQGAPPTPTTALILIPHPNPFRNSLRSSLCPSPLRSSPLRSSQIPKS